MKVVRSPSTRGVSMGSTQAKGCRARWPYFVGLRRRRTILAFPPCLDGGEGEPILPEGVVPFPRGFGFGANGDLIWPPA